MKGRLLRCLQDKSKTDRSNLTAYLSVAAGVVCIGCSAIFVKIANVQGMVSAFYRLFIAALVIVPYWAARRPVWPKRQDALLIALLGLGLFSQLAGWLAINKALGRLRAAPVSVSLLAQPVVTAILGILFLGESLQASDLLGGMLVLAGNFLVNQR